MKTEIIRLDPAGSPDEAAEAAARVIGAGGVVVFPTETVYGLGGDGGRGEVRERICEIKGRERDKPLARLIADPREVEGLLRDAGHRRLVEKFWPGPLTLVLRGPDGTKQGFRLPDFPFIRKVIGECGCPLVATSANPSGGPEITGGEEARAEFAGLVDLIIDGGEVSGSASTVLDLTVRPEKILREGPVSREEIEEVLGREISGERSR